MKTFKYECKFCGKKYKIESKFLGHSCKVKVRVDETKTIKGQRAFGIYSRFMKEKFNKNVDTPTFIDSKYYAACYRFVDFADKMGLVDINVYLQIMSTKNLTPDQWNNHLAYSFYLENIDKFIKPEKQIAISVDTIMDICEEYKVETSKFFEVINQSDLLELITSREISPWLILPSGKFKKYYKNDLSSYSKNKMSELIDGKHWSAKMKINPKIRQMAEECIRELML